ncbi:MAG TPA: hypothetical protein PLW97_09705 [Synergistaceae bacterium]|nr:hypothetical protein [Synergistaceae bacterium]
MNIKRKSAITLAAVWGALLWSLLLLGGPLPAQAQDTELPPLPPLQTVAANPQFDIDAILQRTPVEASAAEVKQAAAEIPVTRTQDATLGVETVQTETLEEGLKIVAAELGTGVRAIKAGSGIAFVATGIGDYRLYPNPNASRMSMRQAYVTALMNAKRELLTYLRGLSLQASQELYSSAQDFVDDTETLANRSDSYAQEIQRFTSGMIRGFTAYKVVDDHDKHVVYVSIVTSPKIRQAALARSNSVLEAANVATGLKRVFREIEGGVVPPVGGRVISVPETGEVAVISFGSSIILDYDGASASKEQRIASNRAKADADQAMVGILTGEDFLWESGMFRTQDESSANFETILKEDPYGNTVEERKKLAEIRNTFLAQTRDGEHYKGIIQGNLPPGINSKTWISEDNGWAFVANVYLPSATAAAKEAARELGITVPEAPDMPKAPPAEPFDPGKGPSGQIQEDSSL